MASHELITNRQVRWYPSREPRIVHGFPQMHRLVRDSATERGQGPPDLGLLWMQSDAQRSDDGPKAVQGRIEGQRPGDGGQVDS